MCSCTVAGCRKTPVSLLWLPHHEPPHARRGSSGRLGHLQPAARPVQAQRVPQGHPAVDGAETIRLRASGHQAGGDRRQPQARRPAGECPPPAPDGRGGASVLQHLGYGLPSALGRLEPDSAEPRALHQRLLRQCPRDCGPLRAWRADNAHGPERPALRGRQAVRQTGPVA